MKVISKGATLLFVVLSTMSLTNSVYAAFSDESDFGGKKMSETQNIDEVIQNTYGLYGLSSFKVLKNVVNKLSETGTISYNSQNGVFEILNGGTMSKKSLEKELNMHKYVGWKPRVEGKASNGNLRVKFMNTSIEMEPKMLHKSTEYQWRAPNMVSSNDNNMKQYERGPLWITKK